MKVLRISLAAVAGLAILAAVSPATAGEEASPRFAAETPRGLSIPQVYEKLTALGYWNIDKIERDPGAYEVRANERSGERVKLYVDARTGEIIETRRDRRHNSRDEHRDDSRWRGSPDCNERRCRDDLPARETSAPPVGR